MARALQHALDPVAWAADRLGFIADPWQAALLRTSARQVLLNCSRQSGKTTTTAVLAAHVATFRPGSLILLVSKAQRQSAEMLTKVQAFLRTAGAELEQDAALSSRLANGSRIVSLPGDGSTVRGFSAPALVVEDEAAFVEDALYHAVRPMLAVSGGRMVLMSTPHGKRGHFYEAWTKGGPAWQRESVTAERCPRIPREWLATERATIGEYWYRQEFGCEFVETSDQLFSEAAIERAFSHAPDPLF